MMDMNAIFGVLGILATVIFGGLSIYLVVTRRYPGQITFIREDTIALFDSIVKNFPELEVLYQEKPVTEGLVLLKGSLLNTGSKDITPEMVAEEIALTLPDGFRWRGARIISHSPEHHGNVNLSQQKITCQMNMFRCGEHVRFEAVAEVPVAPRKTKDSEKTMEQRLDSAIRITHRIADTDSVKIRDFPDEAYANRRLKRFRLPGIMLVLIMILPFGIYFFEAPARLRFTFPRDGNEIQVLATPRRDGSVVLKGVEPKSFSERLPVQDFFATPGLKVSTQPHDFFPIFLAGAFLVNGSILGLLLFSIYRDIWQAKRLRRLLSIGDTDVIQQDEN